MKTIFCLAVLSGCLLPFSFADLLDTTNIVSTELPPTTSKTSVDLEDLESSTSTVETTITSERPSEESSDYSPSTAEPFQTTNNIASTGGGSPTATPSATENHNVNKRETEEPNVPSTSLSPSAWTGSPTQPTTTEPETQPTDPPPPDEVLLPWYLSVPIVLATAGAIFLLYLLFARRRRFLSLLELGYSELAEAFIKGGEAHISNTQTPIGRALQAPFSRIIPANDIIPAQTTAADSCIGEGKFGIVYKAHYGDRLVAVKTVTRNDLYIEDLRMFLRTVKLTVYVGDHENLVKFYGADVAGLRRGSVRLVFERCSQGDLWTYLRQINSITGCEVVEDLYEVIQPKVRQPEKDKRKTACTSMMFHVLNPLMNHSSESSKPSTSPRPRLERQETSFSQKSFRKRTVRFAAEPTFSPSNARTIPVDQLHRWAYQIASGMEYLEQKAVVHGDLAARNILVCDDMSVRISDAGFAKNLYLAVGGGGGNGPAKKKHCPLPWRWASPETLSRLEFSTKADVWAFGVTVWEMFTLGGIPFLEHNLDGLFQIRVQNGLRPMPPKDMQRDLYYFTLGPCWEMDPENRPSFERVKALWAAVVQGRPLSA